VEGSDAIGRWVAAALGRCTTESFEAAQGRTAVPHARRRESLHEIRKAARALDRHLLSDPVGLHLRYVCILAHVPGYETNTVRSPTGGGLGFSDPAAISPPRSCTDRPSVVAVNGDGCFMMNSQELETAVRLTTRSSRHLGGTPSTARSLEQDKKFGRHSSLFDSPTPTSWLSGRVLGMPLGAESRSFERLSATAEPRSAWISHRGDRGCRFRRLDSTLRFQRKLGTEPVATYEHCDARAGGFRQVEKIVQRGGG